MKHLLLVALAVVVITGVRADAQSGYDLFQKALATERADGNLREAIQIYERVVKQFAGDRPLVARALVRIADCHEKLGQRDASKVYERIVREFADQADSVTVARARLNALQGPALQAAQAIKKIWAGGDVDAMGSPSADGRFLSYTRWTTGDLAIRDLAEGTSRLITNTGGWEVSGDYAEFSLLSPDARQVAYAWFVDKGGDPTAKCACEYELRVMSISGADAGKPRIVLPRGPGNYWVQPVAWTPDGKSLVILRSTSASAHDVAIMTLANNAVRVIKTVTGQAPSRISLSPDGQLLALDIDPSRDSNGRDIVMLPIDGGTEIPAVQNPAHDYAPAFSHDGSQLVFLSDRTGINSLWRQPVSSGKPTGAPVMVAPASSGGSVLGTTRSGGVYFWTGGPNSNVYSVGFDPATMHATATARIAVERFQNTNAMPAVSPDGAQLAYLSRRGSNQRNGSTVLVIRNLATNQDRDLPLNLLATNGGVSWFPDNRSLLFAARDAEQPRLHYYRIDVVSGEQQLLLSPRGRGIPHARPQVSPDGKSIYFVETTGSQGPARLLARYDLATRQQTEVRTLSEDSNFMSFQISPDGNEVAYLRSDESGRLSILEVMPSAGGTSREIFRERAIGQSRFSGLAWSPDKKYILVARENDLGVAGGMAGGSFWKVPVAGGAAEPANIAMPGMVRFPTLDPIGKRLFFAAFGGGEPAIWSVENFLPRK